MVIADFELGCRRKDNWRLRAQVIDADGQQYSVSTGMGVLDWLHALAHLTVATKGFIPALTNKIRQVTQNQEQRVFANTLSPEMATWQLLLEAIYEEFPAERQAELWPELDRDVLPKSLKPWAEFNPITGFLGQQPECREFFDAADVRVALMNWRARDERS